MKKTFSQLLEEDRESVLRKAAHKLPSWVRAGAIDFPGSLCLEQCSSEAAAHYKASFVKGAGIVADLTGGLGVDSVAFSQVAGDVLYYERNPELAAAAFGNFEKLGAANIAVCCAEVGPGQIDALPVCGWIYADPARRSAAGRKVFLLEDCEPDILTLLPSIWQKTTNVMLKLSPMADISMVASRLGSELAEIHIVALKGEVKELLCILKAGNTAGYTETVVELEDGGSLAFRPEDEAAAVAVPAPAPEPGDFLYEPRPALLKAGLFKLPCTRCGLRKFAPSTHLYTGPGTPVPFFKIYRIRETAPLGKSTLKDFAARYPGASVSARNLPLGSEELRSRMKMGAATRDGTHIFGCTLGKEKILIAADTLSRKPGQ